MKGKQVKTGYVTHDRPWEQFYEGIDQNSLFLNTTPYIGLVENNKNYPDEVAVEYFGAKISFKVLFRNIDIVAKALVAYGIKKWRLRRVELYNA